MYVASTKALLLIAVSLASLKASVPERLENVVSLRVNAPFRPSCSVLSISGSSFSTTGSKFKML